MSQAYHLDMICAYPHEAVSSQAKHATATPFYTLAESNRVKISNAYLYSRLTATSNIEQTISRLIIVADYHEHNTKRTAFDDMKYSVT